MGVKAIFKCKACGNEFQAEDGGGVNFTMLRCVDCDATKDVDVPLKDNVRCRKCGGEMREDLGPMCRKCKSRNVEKKDVIEYYD